MFAYKLDFVKPILEFSAKRAHGLIHPYCSSILNWERQSFQEFLKKKTLCGYSICQMEKRIWTLIISVLILCFVCPDHTSFKSGQVNFSILMFWKSFIHFIPTILSHMNVAGEGSLI